MSEFLLSVPEPDDWPAALQLGAMPVPHRLAIANVALAVAGDVLLTRNASREIVIDEALRERIGELERAQTVKDQLVARVSHEMRTPLAAIGGYVELLRMGMRGPLNDGQLGDLQRIHHAYEHLLHIVNDLLSYHKLIAGQFTLDITEVSIDDALVSVADLVAPQAAERQIAVEIERVSPSVVVRADQDRVRQILVNLLGNAIKFTAVGGFIHLCTTIEGDSAVVAVEDTGVGIPPEDLETIFRPFAQLGPDVSGGGAGLGLAISRDMARAMGGDLSVTSVVGEGSRFALRLPFSTSFARARPS